MKASLEIAAGTDRSPACGERRQAAARTRLRVVHCPSMVGGHPQQLARAEREIGLDSTAVAFQRDAFDFATDEVLFAAGDGLIRREFKRWRFLARVLREFDVVHFNFGSSIMPRGYRDPRNARGLVDRLGLWYSRCVELLDLPLLKRAGKRIFVTFQGDDVRQADFCRKNFANHWIDEVGPDYYLPGWDERKRRLIAKFDRYADGLYAVNPDLLHVLPKRTKYLPYCNVDPRAWTPHYLPPAAGRKLTLLHAPSHRGVKGTKYVLQAIEQLRRDGDCNFEFRLIENLPHDEAVRHYRDADLLIDQLFVGLYGGLAVELMALGKPVLSYLRPGDMVYLPQEMQAQMPVVSVTPATIYETLRQWLTTRREELPELGCRSRRFVERWHDPLRWARELKHDYTSAASRAAA